jgi:hypothetical protein
MNFYLQSLVLVAVVLFAVQRRGQVDLLLLAVATSWMVGVNVIYWRYGVVGQNHFYQNDQSFHWQIVAERLNTEFEISFYKLNELRAPYTLPAFALANLGFDVTLSLKFISLCCGLANMRLAMQFLKGSDHRWSPLAFWMIAGPMTTFFSVLALRETMMLLCVTQIFLGRSTRIRFVSLISLVILRPHLAAAVALGRAWGFVFKSVSQKRYLTTLVASVVVPIYLGVLGFPIGQALLAQRPFVFDRSLLGKDQIIQVFSAFAGLQFTTVAFQTVEFSTRSLLLVRVIFPEILLVPLLFLVSCLIYKQEHLAKRIGILSSFVFFTSVSTGTEFLSVRQSLPFMTTLGVLALVTLTRDTHQENIEVGRAANAVASGRPAG